MSRFPVTAAVAAVVIFFTSSGHAAEFTTAFRTPSRAFLLTATGDVLTIAPGEGLTRAFTFTDASRRPYRWTRPPKCFVQWKSQWFVCEMSRRLTRFNAQGAFLGFVDLPLDAGVLAVSGDSIWVLNILARSPAEQLWRSTNGKTFEPSLLAPAGKRFESPAENVLFLAGSPAGELYLAPAIGPPVVHRVWPARLRKEIRVAYSRSKFRAGLEEVIGVVEDPTHYSLPVRDLFALEGGGFVALRNREDVRSDSGRFEQLLGRRADRYDSAGRHVATAVFPASIHWIVSVTPTTVTGANRSGGIVSAKWGKPVAGEVIQP